MPNAIDILMKDIKCIIDQWTPVTYDDHSLKHRLYKSLGLTYVHPMTNDTPVISYPLVVTSKESLALEYLIYLLFSKDAVVDNDHLTESEYEVLVKKIHSIGRHQQAL